MIHVFTFASRRFWGVSFPCFPKMNVCHRVLHLVLDFPSCIVCERLSCALHLSLALSCALRLCSPHLPCQAFRARTLPLASVAHFHHLTLTASRASHGRLPTRRQDANPHPTHRNKTGNKYMFSHLPPDALGGVSFPCFPKMNVWHRVLHLVLDFPSCIVCGRLSGAVKALSCVLRSRPSFKLVKAVCSLHLPCQAFRARTNALASVPSRLARNACRAISAVWSSNACNTTLS